VKKTKPIIAVDADEILAAFIEHFLIYHNEKYQTDVSKDKVFTFKLETLFNIDETLVLSRMNEYYDNREVLKIEPVEGSIEGINQLLKKGYELQIVTARPPFYKELTVEWVEKHFPDKFQQIHFAFNPYNRNSEKMTKAQICKQIGAKVLLDDNLVNALDCASNGITVYLMDAPWNQTDDLPENIIRVKSWKEIVEKLSS
jgi:uncharacterized HAD superfamily protein